jgi:hypothetical protein
MQPSITDSIRQVLGLEDLSPSATVNKVFSHLVNSIIESPDYDIALISPSDVNRVRTVAADAESKLENFWARRVINSDDPISMLANFRMLQTTAILSRGN